MTIIEYCAEEVRRQGHDIQASEGVKRVGWMLEAWSFAMLLHKASPVLRLDQVVEFGRMVEQGKNEQGVRTCGVRVGAVVMPPYERVPDLLTGLCMRQKTLAPFDFYRAFLEIHPFADGNGRVGKILLNWKNDTLHENPIFPPNDFWGGWIQNP